MEIGIVIFFIIVFFIAFIKKDRKSFEISTEPKRGTRAERNLVSILKRSGIPEQTIFHDLYVKKHNGNFSQIDLVVATKVGIIVFEVKDYSGWIFGTGYQSQWTQILAYGQQKYRFYNPILQNNKHISDLRKKLTQFENIPFYSIIVFYGDCILKDVSFVPKGTFLVKPERVIEAMRIIISNNEPAQYTNKNEVVKVLQEAVKNGESPEVQWQHIENVRDMLGKDRIFG